MKSSDEKKLRSRFIDIQNKFERSDKNVGMKHKEFEHLQKVYAEHQKACEELTHGMPMPDDPKYVNSSVVLDANQRKKVVQFKKHYRSMRHCLQKMRRLKIQIEHMNAKTYSQTISEVSDLKESAQHSMIDIINKEALRLAKEKLNNNSNDI